MASRTVRGFFCIALFALFVVAGCAAQTDGASDTNDALGDDGPPPPACKSALCPTRVKEDAAMACYRTVSVALTVQGVVHNGSLYAQLVQASGIDNEQLAPEGSNVCASPAYDCFGVFYDFLGRAMRVPPFPFTATTDADVKRWDASVASFYASAYMDAHAQTKLSPGKASLCTTAVEIEYESHPDPSEHAVMTMLQQIGGEAVVGQNTAWMNAIIAAGAAHGCPTPKLDPNHNESSWTVPTQSAAAFLAAFRPCDLPDTSHVGGCLHSFDGPSGPGNFVKAHALLNACSFTWFVGDPTGGCGMSCYPSHVIHLVH